MLTINFTDLSAGLLYVIINVAGKIKAELPPTSLHFECLLISQ